MSTTSGELWSDSDSDLYSPDTSTSGSATPTTPSEHPFGDVAEPQGYAADVFTSDISSQSSRGTYVSTDVSESTDVTDQDYSTDASAAATRLERGAQERPTAPRRSGNTETDAILSAGVMMYRHQAAAGTAAPAGNAGGVSAADTALGEAAAASLAQMAPEELFARAWSLVPAAVAAAGHPPFPQLPSPPHADRLAPSKAAVEEFVRDTALLAAKRHAAPSLAYFRTLVARNALRAGAVSAVEASGSLGLEALAAVAHAKEQPARTPAAFDWSTAMELAPDAPLPPHMVTGIARVLDTALSAAGGDPSKLIDDYTIRSAGMLEVFNRLLGELLGETSPAEPASHLPHRTQALAMLGLRIAIARQAPALLHSALAAIHGLPKEKLRAPLPAAVPGSEAAAASQWMTALLQTAPTAATVPLPAKSTCWADERNFKVALAAAFPQGTPAVAAFATAERDPAVDPNDQPMSVSSPVVASPSSKTEKDLGKGTQPVVTFFTDLGVATLLRHAPYTLLRRNTELRLRASDVAGVGAIADGDLLQLYHRNGATTIVDAATLAVVTAEPPIRDALPLVTAATTGPEPAVTVEPQSLTIRCPPTKRAPRFCGTVDAAFAPTAESDDGPGTGAVLGGRLFPNGGLPSGVQVEFWLAPDIPDRSALSFNVKLLHVAASAQAPDGFTVEASVANKTLTIKASAGRDAHATYSESVRGPAAHWAFSAAFDGDTIVWGLRKNFAPVTLTTAAPTHPWAGPGPGAVATLLTGTYYGAVSGLMLWGGATRDAAATEHTARAGVAAPRSAEARASGLIAWLPLDELPAARTAVERCRGSLLTFGADTELRSGRDATTSTPHDPDLAAAAARRSEKGKYTHTVPAPLVAARLMCTGARYILVTASGTQHYDASTGLRVAERPNSEFAADVTDVLYACPTTATVFAFDPEHFTLFAAVSHSTLPPAAVARLPCVHAAAAAATDAEERWPTAIAAAVSPPKPRASSLLSALTQPLAHFADGTARTAKSRHIDASSPPPQSPASDMCAVPSLAAVSAAAHAAVARLCVMRGTERVPIVTNVSLSAAAVLVHRVCEMASAAAASPSAWVVLPESKAEDVNGEAAERDHNCLAAVAVVRALTETSSQLGRHMPPGTVPMARSAAAQLTTVMGQHTAAEGFGPDRRKVSPQQELLGVAEDLARLVVSACMAPEEHIRIIVGAEEMSLVRHLLAPARFTALASELLATGHAKAFLGRLGEWAVAEAEAIYARRTPSVRAADAFLTVTLVALRALPLRDRSGEEPIHFIVLRALFDACDAVMAKAVKWAADADSAARAHLDYVLQSTIIGRALFPAAFLLEGHVSPAELDRVTTLRNTVAKIAAGFKQTPALAAPLEECGASVTDAPTAPAEPRTVRFTERRRITRGPETPGSFDALLKLPYAASVSVQAQLEGAGPTVQGPDMALVLLDTDLRPHRAAIKAPGTHEFDTGGQLSLHAEMPSIKYAVTVVVEATLELPLPSAHWLSDLEEGLVHATLGCVERMLTSATTTRPAAPTLTSPVATEPAVEVERSSAGSATDSDDDSDDEARNIFSTESCLRGGLIDDTAAHGSDAAHAVAQLDLAGHIAVVAFVKGSAPDVAGPLVEAVRRIGAPMAVDKITDEAQAQLEGIQSLWDTELFGAESTAGVDGHLRRRAEPLLRALTACAAWHGTGTDVPLRAALVTAWEQYVLPEWRLAAELAGNDRQRHDAAMAQVMWVLTDVAPRLKVDALAAAAMATEESFFREGSSHVFASGLGGDSATGQGASSGGHAGQTPTTSGSARFPAQRGRRRRLLRATAAAQVGESDHAVAADLMALLLRDVPDVAGLKAALKVRYASAETFITAFVTLSRLARDVPSTAVVAGALAVARRCFDPIAASKADGDDERTKAADAATARHFMHPLLGCGAALEDKARAAACSLVDALVRATSSADNKVQGDLHVDRRVAHALTDPSPHAVRNMEVMALLAHPWDGADMALLPASVLLRPLVAAIQVLVNSSKDAPAKDDDDENEAPASRSRRPSGAEFDAECRKATKAMDGVNHAGTLSVVLPNAFASAPNGVRATASSEDWTWGLQVEDEEATLVAVQRWDVSNKGRLPDILYFEMSVDMDTRVGEEDAEAAAAALSSKRYWIGVSRSGSGTGQFGRDRDRGKHQAFVSNGDVFPKADSRFGPGFTAGDTVGCGLIRDSNAVFFTKNGQFLGVAFDECLKSATPMVGCEAKRGAIVRLVANFGTHRPFKFDFTALHPSCRTKEVTAFHSSTVALHALHNIVVSSIASIELEASKPISTARDAAATALHEAVAAAAALVKQCIAVVTTSALTAGNDATAVQHAVVVKHVLPSMLTVLRTAAGAFSSEHVGAATHVELLSAALRLLLVRPDGSYFTPEATALTAEEALHLLPLRRIGCTLLRTAAAELSEGALAHASRTARARTNLDARDAIPVLFSMLEAPVAPKEAQDAYHPQWDGFSVGDDNLARGVGDGHNAYSKEPLPMKGSVRIGFQFRRSGGRGSLGGCYYCGVRRGPPVPTSDMKVSELLQSPDHFVVQDADDNDQVASYLLGTGTIPLNPGGRVYGAGDILWIEVDREAGTLTAYRQSQTESSTVLLGVAFDAIPTNEPLYPFAHLFNNDSTCRLHYSTASSSHSFQPVVIGMSDARRTLQQLHATPVFAQHILDTLSQRLAQPSAVVDGNCTALTVLGGSLDRCVASVDRDADDGSAGGSVVVHHSEGSLATVYDAEDSEMALRQMDVSRLQPTRPVPAILSAATAQPKDIAACVDVLAAQLNRTIFLVALLLPVLQMEQRARTALEAAESAANDALASAFAHSTAAAALAQGRRSRHGLDFVSCAPAIDRRLCSPRLRVCCDFVAATPDTGKGEAVVVRLPGLQDDPRPVGIVVRAGAAQTRIQGRVIYAFVPRGSWQPSDAPETLAGSGRHASSCYALQMTNSDLSRHTNCAALERSVLVVSGECLWLKPTVDAPTGNATWRAAVTGAGKTTTTPGLFTIPGSKSAKPEKASEKAETKRKDRGVPAAMDLVVCIPRGTSIAFVRESSAAAPRYPPRQTYPNMARREVLQNWDTEAYKPFRTCASCTAGLPSPVVAARPPYVSATDKVSLCPSCFDAWAMPTVPFHSLSDATFERMVSVYPPRKLEVGATVAVDQTPLLAWDRRATVHADTVAASVVAVAPHAVATSAAVSIREPTRLAVRLSHRVANQPGQRLVDVIPLSRLLTNSETGTAGSSFTIGTPHGQQTRDAQAVWSVATLPPNAVSYFAVEIVAQRRVADPWFVGIAGRSAVPSDIVSRSQTTSTTEAWGMTCGAKHPFRVDSAATLHFLFDAAAGALYAATSLSALSEDPGCLVKDGIRPADVSGALRILFATKDEVTVSLLCGFTCVVEKTDVAALTGALPTPLAVALVPPSEGFPCGSAADAAAAGCPVLYTPSLVCGGADSPLPRSQAVDLLAHEALTICVDPVKQTVTFRRDGVPVATRPLPPQLVQQGARLVVFLPLPGFQVEAAPDPFEAFRFATVERVLADDLALVSLEDTAHRSSHHRAASSTGSSSSHHGGAPAGSLRVHRSMLRFVSVRGSAADKDLARGFRVAAVGSRPGPPQRCIVGQRDHGKIVHVLPRDAAASGRAEAERICDVLPENTFPIANENVEAAPRPPQLPPFPASLRVDGVQFAVGVGKYRQSGSASYNGIMFDCCTRSTVEITDVSFWSHTTNTKRCRVFLRHGSMMSVTRNAAQWSVVADRTAPLQSNTMCTLPIEHTTFRAGETFALYVQVDHNCAVGFYTDDDGCHGAVGDVIDDDGTVSIMMGNKSESSSPFSDISRAGRGFRGTITYNINTQFSPSALAPLEAPPVSTAAASSSGAAAPAQDAQALGALAAVANATHVDEAMSLTTVSSWTAERAALSLSDSRRSSDSPPPAASAKSLAAAAGHNDPAIAVMTLQLKSAVVVASLALAVEPPYPATSAHVQCFAREDAQDEFDPADSTWLANAECELDDHGALVIPLHRKLLSGTVTVFVRAAGGFKFLRPQEKETLTSPDFVITGLVGSLQYVSCFDLARGLHDAREFEVGRHMNPASSASYNGMMFELVAREDVILQEVFCVSQTSSTNVGVAVFWKEGAMEGEERNATAWQEVLSVRTDVRDMEHYSPGPLNIRMRARRRYSIYINTTSSCGVRFFNTTDGPLGAVSADYDTDGIMCVHVGRKSESSRPFGDIPTEARGFRGRIAYQPIPPADRSAAVSRIDLPLPQARFMTAVLSSVGHFLASPAAAAAVANAEPLLAQGLALLAGMDAPDITGDVVRYEEAMRSAAAPIEAELHNAVVSVAMEYGGATEGSNPCTDLTAGDAAVDWATGRVRRVVSVDGTGSTAAVTLAAGATDACGQVAELGDDAGGAVPGESLHPLLLCPSCFNPIATRTCAANNNAAHALPPSVESAQRSAIRALLQRHRPELAHLADALLGRTVTPSVLRRSTMGSTPLLPGEPRSPVIAAPSPLMASGGTITGQIAVVSVVEGAKENGARSVAKSPHPDGACLADLLVPVRVLVPGGGTTAGGLEGDGDAVDIVAVAESMCSPEVVLASHLWALSVTRTADGALTATATTAAPLRCDPHVLQAYRVTVSVPDTAYAVHRDVVIAHRGHTEFPLGVFASSAALRAAPSQNVGGEPHFRMHFSCTPLPPSTPTAPVPAPAPPMRLAPLPRVGTCTVGGRAAELFGPLRVGMFAAVSQRRPQISLGLTTAATVTEEALSAVARRPLQQGFEVHPAVPVLLHFGRDGVDIYAGGTRAVVNVTGDGQPIAKAAAVYVLFVDAAPEDDEHRPVTGPVMAPVEGDSAAPMGYFPASWLKPDSVGQRDGAYFAASGQAGASCVGSPLPPFGRCAFRLAFVRTDRQPGQPLGGGHYLGICRADLSDSTVELSVLRDGTAPIWAIQDLSDKDNLPGQKILNPREMGEQTQFPVMFTTHEPVDIIVDRDQRKLWVGRSGAVELAFDNLPHAGTPLAPFARVDNRRAYVRLLDCPVDFGPSVPGYAVPWSRDDDTASDNATSVPRTAPRGLAVNLASQGPDYAAVSVSGDATLLPASAVPASVLRVGLAPLRAAYVAFDRIVMALPASTRRALESAWAAAAATHVAARPSIARARLERAVGELLAAGVFSPGCSTMAADDSTLGGCSVLVSPKAIHARATALAAVIRDLHGAAAWVLCRSPEAPTLPPTVAPALSGAIKRVVRDASALVGVELPATVELLTPVTDGRARVAIYDESLPASGSANVCVGTLHLLPIDAVCASALRSKFQPRALAISATVHVHHVCRTSHPTAAVCPVVTTRCDMPLLEFITRYPHAVTAEFASTVGFTLLCAVEHYHHHGIAHSGVHPANIFVSAVAEKQTVLVNPVAEFPPPSAFTEGPFGQRGTSYECRLWEVARLPLIHPFTSPEGASTFTASAAGDIWAIGAVLALLGSVRAARLPFTREPLSAAATAVEPDALLLQQRAALGVEEAELPPPVSAMSLSDAEPTTTTTAAAPPPPPPRPSTEWSCPACTFLNPMSRPACDMCETPRPEQAPQTPQAPTPPRAAASPTSVASKDGETGKSGGEPRTLSPLDLRPLLDQDAQSVPGGTALAEVLGGMLALEPEDRAPISVLQQQRLFESEVKRGDKQMEPVGFTTGKGFHEGTSSYNGIMFNIVSQRNPLEIKSITFVPDCSSALQVTIFRKNGTFMGSESVPSAWKQLQVGRFQPQQRRQRMTVPLETPLQLGAGETVGLFIHTDNSSGMLYYTDDDGINVQQGCVQEGDDELAVSVGKKCECSTPEFRRIPDFRRYFRGTITYINRRPRDSRRTFLAAPAAPLPITGLSSDVPLGTCVTARSESFSGNGVVVGFEGAPQAAAASIAAFRSSASGTQVLIRTLPGPDSAVAPGSLVWVPRVQCSANPGGTLDQWFEGATEKIARSPLGLWTRCNTAPVPGIDMALQPMPNYALRPTSNSSDSMSVTHGGRSVRGRGNVVSSEAFAGRVYLLQLALCAMPPRDRDTPLAGMQTYASDVEPQSGVFPDASVPAPAVDGEMTTPPLSPTTTGSAPRSPGVKPSRVAQICLTSATAADRAGSRAATPVGGDSVPLVSVDLRFPTATATLAAPLSRSANTSFVAVPLPTAAMSASPAGSAVFSDSALPPAQGPSEWTSDGRRGRFFAKPDATMLPAGAGKVSEAVLIVDGIHGLVRDGLTGEVLHRGAVAGMHLSVVNPSVADIAVALAAVPLATAPLELPRLLPVPAAAARIARPRPNVAQSSPGVALHRRFVATLPVPAAPGVVHTSAVVNGWAVSIEGVVGRPAQGTNAATVAAKVTLVQVPGLAVQAAPQATLLRREASALMWARSDVSTPGQSFGPGGQSDGCDPRVHVRQPLLVSPSELSAFSYTSLFDAADAATAAAAKATADAMSEAAAGRPHVQPPEDLRLAVPCSGCRAASIDVQLSFGSDPVLSVGSPQFTRPAALGAAIATDCAPYAAWHDHHVTGLTLLGPHRYQHRVADNRRCEAVLRLSDDAGDPLLTALAGETGTSAASTSAAPHTHRIVLRVTLPTGGPVSVQFCTFGKGNELECTGRRLELPGTFVTSDAPCPPCTTAAHGAFPIAPTGSTAAGYSTAAPAVHIVTILRDVASHRACIAVASGAVDPVFIPDVTDKCVLTVASKHIGANVELLAWEAALCGDGAAAHAVLWTEIAEACDAGDGRFAARFVEAAPAVTRHSVPPLGKATRTATEFSGGVSSSLPELLTSGEHALMVSLSRTGFQALFARGHLKSFPPGVMLDLLSRAGAPTAVTRGFLELAEAPVIARVALASVSLLSHSAAPDEGPAIGSTSPKPQDDAEAAPAAAGSQRALTTAPSTRVCVVAVHILRELLRCDSSFLAAASVRDLLLQPPLAFDVAVALIHTATVQTREVRHTAMSALTDFFSRVTTPAAVPADLSALLRPLMCMVGSACSTGKVRTTPSRLLQRGVELADSASRLHQRLCLPGPLPTADTHVPDLLVSCVLQFVAALRAGQSPPPFVHALAAEWPWRTVHRKADLAPAPAGLARLCPDPSDRRDSTATTTPEIAEAVDAFRRRFVWFNASPLPRVHGSAVFDIRLVALPLPPTEAQAEAEVQAAAPAADSPPGPTDAPQDADTAAPTPAAVMSPLPTATLDPPAAESTLQVPAEITNDVSSTKAIERGAPNVRFEIGFARRPLTPVGGDRDADEPAGLEYGILYENGETFIVDRGVKAGLAPAQVQMQRAVRFSCRAVYSGGGSVLLRLLTKARLPTSTGSDVAFTSVLHPEELVPYAAYNGCVAHFNTVLPGQRGLHGTSITAPPAVVSLAVARQYDFAALRAPFALPGLNPQPLTFYDQLSAAMAILAEDHDVKMSTFVGVASGSKRAAAPSVPASALDGFPLVLRIVNEAAANVRAERTPSIADESGQVSLEPLVPYLSVWNAMDKLVTRFTPLVDMSVDEEATDAGDAVTINSAWGVMKTFLASSRRASLMESSLAPYTGRSGPRISVVVNVLDARVSRRRGAEATLRASVFGQLHRQLGFHPAAPFFSSPIFNATLPGFGAQDAGGPYREVLSRMALEMQEEHPAGFNMNPLFKTTPNGDALVPDPAMGTAVYQPYFFTMGRFIGSCLVTCDVLSVDLPALFWKRLLGDAVEDADLLGIDRELIDNTAPDVIADDEWAELDEYFPGCAARWNLDYAKRFPAPFGTAAAEALPAEVAALSPDELRDAAAAAKTECVRSCEKTRYDPAISAIRRGASSVVPSHALRALHWRDVRDRVCGKPTVSISDLKKAVRMQLPSDQAGMFWRVVEAMSMEDRSRFLYFATGQRRLPLKSPLKIGTKSGTNVLPTAATCFFTVSIPRYTTDSAMSEKLLYAIRHCTAIDTDGNANGHVVMEE